MKARAVADTLEPGAAVNAVAGQYGDRDVLNTFTAETPLTAADKSPRPYAPDQLARRPLQDLVADVSAE